MSETAGGAVRAYGPARIHLALGFHDHQPVGNFPEVFEEHYRRAYAPFLEVMERYRRVPFALHVTGPLLLWLGERHPDFLARLASLRGSGRLEMKGGGFYEPILASIPEADRVEQLRRMSTHLAEVTGAAPEGAWIAERVWEPHLARSLAEAGLRYAVLDDSHFQSAGVRPHETLGYYVTEEEGRRFDLFPISKELRYLIPFQAPEDTIHYLRHLARDHRERRRTGEVPADAPPPLAVYDDDGEKFGGWPGTHDHVYRSGWLERFLGLLEKEAAEGWLTLTTLGAYRRRYPPLGRIYLPTGSYAEMLEWSGGFYRNFLVRYGEANLLHKRMLHTSRGVRQAASTLDRPLEPATPGGGDEEDADSGLPHRGGRAADAPGWGGGGAGMADGGRSGAAGAAPSDDPDEHRRRRGELLHARDLVLRAQCNDAYWHGVFGGLYLPHLRHAVYAALIEAESLVGAPMRPEVEIVDLDLDGHDEVFLRSPEVTLLVHPAQGGSVISLDHLPSRFALLDTLRRRREPEHAALEEAAAKWAATAASEAPAAGDAHPAAEHSALDPTPGPGDLGPTPGPYDPGPPTGGEEAAGPHTIHEGVRVKEPGLERLLFVDTHPRSAFLDHFFAAETDLRSLVEGRAEDLGDFVAGPYDVLEAAGGPPRARLARRGRVAGARVEVEKTFLLHAETATLEVEYLVRVADEGTHAAEVLFAPEIDLTLLAGWAHDRYVLVDGARPPAARLADEGTHDGAASAALVDESAGLRVDLSWEARTYGDAGEEAPRATLHRYGVVTVSLSEDGFERVYQATCLLPAWPLRLEEGAELRARLRMEVSG